jgi:signal transduction histidine kinase
VPIRDHVRQARRRDTFEAFLSGEVALVALLGAALALFLSRHSLRTPHDLPELRLVLLSLYAIGAALLALLTAVRFCVDGRRFELLLFAGFTAVSISWALFAVGTAAATRSENGAETWACLGGVCAGWIVVASAPFVRGRVERPRTALVQTGLIVAAGLAALWWLSLGRGESVGPRTAAFVLLALANLVAVVGFAARFRRLGEDLDRWLALGATLTLFASLEVLFEPVVAIRYVTQGDFLRLLGYAVLVVGVGRGMLASELRRAVAEERARVARDIHDGLAQYLFAISTHATMLQAGADPVETISKLKQATQAAQTEARFATLALSSAAGSAPFDAALRRYVDFPTADGELDVELDLDPSMRLAPDEQIEVFRIVQEGLGNIRKHAYARRAWVMIGRRGTERLVLIRDDGSGFVPSDGGASQGLLNMRGRAAAIGGALSLLTAPGAGTSLEVVLRP